MGRRVSCTCGTCALCCHRTATRKYYLKTKGHTVATERRTSSDQAWEEIFNRKFRDPDYYKAPVRGPGSCFVHLVEGLVGRGSARRVLACPHAE